MRNILLFITALLSSSALLAQTESAVEKLKDYATNIINFNREYPQEKVYLHMDNRSYYIGDTIWFKAYVMNATTLRPTETSGVLYVELLNDYGVEMEHKKLRMENGMCHGEFVLKDDYRTGYYEIRAYTRNMLNCGNEEIVRLPGTVLVMRPAVVENYNEFAENKQNPQLIMKEAAFREFKQSLIPPINNCVFSRVFPVYKRPRIEGCYKKEMEFYPRHTLLAFPKEISYDLRSNDLNIKFFPEGGALVDGITSIIAFEAVDQWGRKCEISGCITDEDNDTVGQLNTMGRGRGVFYLTPKAREKYHVHVLHKGKEYSFQLPEPAPVGYGLRLMPPIGQNGATAYVTASPNVASQSLGLTLQCRGELLAFDTLTLGCGGIKKVNFPHEMMKAGVNQITLFDESGKILADRLFFVFPRKKSSKLVLRSLPDSISPYEKIRLDFELEDSLNFSKKGLFSLAVTDADDLLDTYDTRNICSELLLSSELRGFIENVDTYFRHSSEREAAADIDLLMLVQGWRRYDWELMSGAQSYQQQYLPEKGLMIDGYIVSGRISSKKSTFRADDYTRIPNLRMNLSMYEKSTIWRDSTSVDSLGQFCVNIKPLIYGEKGLELKLLSMREEPKVLAKKRPYIILNRAFSPSACPYSFYQNHTPSESKLLDMNFTTISLGTEIIDEVIVNKHRKGKREIYYDRPELVIDYYREWNSIIDRGIPLVLVQQSSNIGRRTGISLDYSLGRVGIPLTYLELHTSSGALNLSYLLPQRVKVYSNLLSRRNILLLDKDNEKKMQSLCIAESDQHIIAPKKPPYETQDNMRHTYFEGYSRVANFYNPDYSECALPDSVDYRRTLYWNPDVRTDQHGRASISFYNSKRAKKLHVRAEGFTRYGEFIVYDSEKE